MQKLKKYVLERIRSLCGRALPPSSPAENGHSAFCTDFLFRIGQTVKNVDWPWKHGIKGIVASVLLVVLLGTMWTLSYFQVSVFRNRLICFLLTVFVVSKVFLTILMKKKYDNILQALANLKNVKEVPEVEKKEIVSPVDYTPVVRRNQLRDRNGRFLH